MSNGEAVDGAGPQPPRAFTMPDAENIKSLLERAGLLTDPAFDDFYTVLRVSYSGKNLTGEAIARRWESAVAISLSKFPNIAEARSALDSAFTGTVDALLTDPRVASDAKAAHAKIIESRGQKKD